MYLNKEEETKLVFDKIKMFIYLSRFFVSSLLLHAINILINALLLVHFKLITTRAIQTHSIANIYIYIYIYIDIYIRMIICIDY